MTNATASRRLRKAPSAALLALLCAAPAAAQDEPLYQVEVLVFRHTQPTTAGELWVRPEPPADPLEAPADPFGAPAYGDDTLAPEPLAEVEEDAPLTAETIPLGRFEIFAADAYRLGDAAAKIGRASRFSPLVHTGWIQPGLVIEESTAKGVAGSDDAAQVEGRVVLSRGRYLHLDLDLTLRTQDGEYRLRQSRRRVLLGRYNYIDHPMVSAIAIVTRAPEPEEAPPEDEPPAADDDGKAANAGN